MEHNYDSGNYTNHYIKKFCSTNPFFEAFQNLINMKYPDSKDNFDYGKKYENYFKSASVEHLNIPKVSSVKKYCRSWFPEDPDTVGTIPGDKNSVVLMGFVLKLSADETNTLLKAAGYTELGGRIFDEAITIYSLNNKLVYDEYIEIRNKLKMIYTEYVAKKEENQKDIKTIADLKAYLDIEDEVFSHTVQKLTIVMTDTVQKLENETQLSEYVKSNALIFSDFRETSRRYICKYLLKRLEKEQNAMDFDKISFEHIWKEFEMFYCYTTRVEEANDADLIVMQYDEAEYEADTNRSAHLLSRFINGGREVKRKFFILFLIFLGLRNIAKIDYCCANCGFDIISNEHIDNGFDDFVYYLLKQKDDIDFRLFLATVTEEIANEGFVPPIYLYKKGEL